MAVSHVLVLLLLWLGTSHALRMFETFGDAMVLSNDKPALHGTTSPGAVVVVEESSNHYSVKAEPDGLFIVSLKPRAPSTNGTGITISVSDSSGGKASAREVLFGEIFLCSGQSNMVHPVSYDYNATAQIAAATYPRVRLFQVGRQPTPHPQQHLACNATDTMPVLTPNCSARNQWYKLSPTTVPTFSAVCYFTIQEILRNVLGTDYPVGLIESDWGGSPQGAWESTFVNSSSPQSVSVPPTVQEKPAYCQSSQLLIETRSLNTNHVPTYLGAQLWPARVCNEPIGCLFNGMIWPLAISTYPRAVLWYQGEADQTNDYPPTQYLCRFQSMQYQWRSTFGIPHLPFYIVQLSAYFTPQPEHTFPSIRVAQGNGRISPGGYAVTHDIGDEAGGVHPHNKTEVGRRLSLSMRNQIYNQTDIKYESPNATLATSSAQTNSISVVFSFSQGLRWQPTHNCTTCCDDRGRSVQLSTTSITQWISAPATVNSSIALLVSMPQGIKVQDVKFVRYAWSNVPECVLFDVEEQLPAGPFYLPVG
eukprot:m.18497 g.18497  ORF g.18497 m.18497 type:complete len:534 (-) comp11907_c0_seq1:46-1647(-)